METVQTLTNLPAPRTRLIGRDADVAAVRDLALHGEGRLVTLTGGGGLGKTSLALEVARGLLGQVHDGVWLVELAPLADPALVPQAVATPLGVREGSERPLLEGLITHLRPRTVILVLDNVEHLVDTCAALADALLSACPALRILATGRAPLHGAGGVTWRVPSLVVPGLRADLSPDHLGGVPAVQLFVERARAAEPTFALMAANAAAVAHLCRRLEGIPLALELAAARVRSLEPAALAARLDERFFLLLTGGARTAPTRQQTLRATLDWSHQLLEEPEQTLLRRLAVFAGGFELEAAEAVCPGEGVGAAAVIDLVDRLVDKSLVVGEGGRYRLLEPIRQYAYERLDGSGEANAVRRRHAEHYLAVARQADRLLRGPRQMDGFARLNREANNLWEALEWAEQEAQDDLGLELAAALGWHWFYDEHLAEGERWLGTFLARCPADSPTRAWALACLACMALVQEGEARAAALAEESRALARQLGDAAAEAFAAIPLSRGLFRRDGPVAGRRAAVEAQELACGDPWLTAMALDSEGHALKHMEGEAAAAEAQYRQSVALFRVAGAHREAAGAGMGLAALLLRRGVHMEASGVTREALSALHAQRTLYCVAEGIDILAGAAAATGHPERAARLFGATAALREAAGRTRWAHMRLDFERREAAARSELGETAFAKAWDQGRQLSPEQAIAEALAATSAPAAPPTARERVADVRAGTLTRREREVLALLARGLSNQQIADDLVITQSTAAFHVHNILGKLDLASRARAAACAVAHGLTARPGG